MCGLAGIVGRAGKDAARSAKVRRMAATLYHRGPDGAGHAALDGCDLGFRRLAIVDVFAPAPPFSNEDGSIWSVCNGEIYNAAELRLRLEARGHAFRTHVDTEVIPHLYEERGADLVQDLDGMFAFAVWDQPRQRLTLGRDRAGEKPMFYWRGDDELVFASELRSILSHPAVRPSLDPVALRRYLLHDYFPAPLTPLRGVRKLPAAHVMTFEAGKESLRRYWDLADHFDPRPPAPRRPAAAAERLDGLVAQAVSSRAVSDAPVGVFLSGGLDSSLILAHLTAQRGRGVPVFSLGHADRSADESHLARRTAEELGADYDELILTAADLEEGLRQVGESMDEPLGDSSCIPTYLLASRARRKVKVVLSGEGGDELFAGYPTYPGARMARLFRRLPRTFRRNLGDRLRALLPPGEGDVGPAYLLARFLRGAERSGVEGHHAWFGSFAPETHARLLAPDVARALVVDDPFTAARVTVESRRFPDALAELLYTDFAMYLQDGLLTKVDRMTMLASLEARAPYLDHRLAEFAAGLPSSVKLRGFRTKWILRRAARGRVPRSVLTRRKRGFNIPFSRWLLDGLGLRLRARFSEERVRARGIFASAGIATLIDDHLARRADNRKPLYNLLALDLWCDRVWGEGAAVPLAAMHAGRAAELCTA
ncbi:MAG: asparagine synthase (glutamine-hydrolyzing) [Acidobacteria bacterium]|nr:asparagine synthase (glutamine-hydrolyzing) [Acidobacteriota bacterium]